MAGEKIVLTREGRDKLVRELECLKGEKRREIARALAEARGHGDLSENAEYDAAKEAQAHNEKKIGELEDILVKARLIDDSKMPKDEALIGATIRVVDLNTNEKFDYMLVSEEESDFDQNKISISSPVGKAFLGHKVGDVVEVKVPAGVLRYELIEIKR